MAQIAQTTLMTAQQICAQTGGRALTESHPIRASVQQDGPTAAAIRISMSVASASADTTAATVLPHAKMVPLALI